MDEDLEQTPVATEEAEPQQDTPDLANLHDELVGHLTSDDFLKQHPRLPHPDRAERRGFNGDKGIGEIGSQIGDAYERSMKDAGASQEDIDGFRPHLEKEAKRRAKELALQSLANSQPRYASEWENDPFFGDVRKRIHDRFVKQGMEAIQNDQGEMNDYLQVAAELRRQTEDANKGGARQALDWGLGVGKGVSQLGMLGGPAGLLGAGKGATLLAKAATTGAAYSAVQFPLTGAQDLLDGKPLGEVARNEVKDFITYSMYGAAGLFGREGAAGAKIPERAMNYAIDTIKLLAAGEVSKEAAHGVGATSEGSTLLQLARPGLSSEDRSKLFRKWVYDEAGPLVVMDAVMRGMRHGEKIDPKAMSDRIIGDELNQQVLPPEEQAKQQIPVAEKAARVADQAAQPAPEEAKPAPSEDEYIQTEKGWVSRREAREQGLQPVGEQKAAEGQPAQPSAPPVEQTPREKLDSLTNDHLEAVRGYNDAQAELRAAQRDTFTAGGQKRLRDARQGVKDAKRTLRGLERQLEEQRSAVYSQKEPETAPETAPVAPGQPISPEGGPEPTPTEPSKRSKEFDIGNRLAFDEAGPSKAVAVTDVDKLGKVPEGRRKDIIQGKIDALKAAGLEPFHSESDEFLVRGGSKAELAAKLEDARNRLQQSHGADFSYGASEKGMGDADDWLREHKARKADLETQKNESRLERMRRQQQEYIGPQRTKEQVAQEPRPAKVMPAEERETARHADEKWSLDEEVRRKILEEKAARGEITKGDLEKELAKKQPATKEPITLPDTPESQEQRARITAEIEREMQDEHAHQRQELGDDIEQLVADGRKRGLGEASLRRAIAERLQQGLANGAASAQAQEAASRAGGQGARIPEDAGTAGGGAERPEAAVAGGGEADRNELRPQHVRDMGSELRKHDRIHTDDENDIRRQTWGMLKEHGTTPQSFGKQEDSSKIAGLDEAADYWQARRPDIFRADETPIESMHRFMKAGMRKYMTVADSEQRARDHFKQNEPTQEEIADVNATLKKAGSAPLNAEDIAEAQRAAAAETAKDGLEAGGSDVAHETGPIAEDAFDFDPEQLDGPTAGQHVAGVLGRLVADESGAFDPAKILKATHVDELADDIKKAIAPASRGEEAAIASGSMRENLATMAREKGIAQAILKAGEKFMNQHILGALDPATRNDRFLEFTDAMQKGEIHKLPTEMQSFAQAARDLIDGRTDKLVDRDLVQSTIEDYMSQLWKRRGSTMTPEQIGRMLSGRRPMAGKEGFRKERFYETYRDGIDAGLEPIDWNPVRLVLRSLEQMDKSIMAHDVREELEDQGLRVKVGLKDRAPDGWVRGKDRADSVFTPGTEGGPVLRGSYYYPEPVATLIDNHLAPGLRGNRIYDVTREFGNVLNNFQLGFGAFHAGFVTMDTQISSAALGLQQLSRGQFADAAKSLLTAPVAPFKAFIEGSKVMKEYFKPGSQGAETADIVSMLEEAGGRAKMDEFYKGNHLQRFRDSLSSIKQGQGGWGGLLYNALPALSEAISAPIMEGLVPRMKLGVFADMARQEIGRLPPDAEPNLRRQVLGKAWDSVENRLGQMTYDNLFWNRTGKDLAMIGVRSVGWNLGTARELGGGVKDIPASIAGAVRGEGISPRLAYTVALPLVTAFYGAIYNYLATGESPQEMKDYFFPRTGAVKNGVKERVSLPSYMRDVGHLANRGDEGPMRVLQNAAEMAAGKVNPALSLVGEMLFNKDFYGSAIRNPNDPAVKQALDTAKHLGKAFEPFSIRGITQGMQRGIPPGQAAQSLVGITPAPAYINRSAEQQRQQEMGRRVTLTPQERLRRGQR